jgi:hypothetical protein
LTLTLTLNIDIIFTLHWYWHFRHYWCHFGHFRHFFISATLRSVNTQHYIFISWRYWYIIDIDITLLTLIFRFHFYHTLNNTHNRRHTLIDTHTEYHYTYWYYWCLFLHYSTLLFSPCIHIIAINIFDIHWYTLLLRHYWHYRRHYFADARLIFRLHIDISSHWMNRHFAI